MNTFYLKRDGLRYEINTTRKDCWNVNISVYIVTEEKYYEFVGKCCCNDVNYGIDYIINNRKSKKG